MGKAERNRKQSARERIAAQQAAARKAEARRRMLWFGGAIVVVLAIVVAIVVVKLGSKSSPPASSGDRHVLPASVLKGVYTVPPATLDKVGGGSVLSFNPQPVTAVSDTALTSNGKPEMLYIGAEFCPYCAAMRWSMAVALSRFGTFTTPLRGIHSSSTDTDPSTPTLTFYQSRYSSKYLEFVPVENETVAKTPLQNTTTAQTAIWNKYDADSYPFIDFGSKYVIKAPIYNPQVLAGLTWAQIAADLHNPSSPVAQGALGAANYITAAICKMTNSAPASVCTSSAVSSLEGKL
jgi:thiol-disulfide isomerase/thioredoxin